MTAGLKIRGPSGDLWVDTNHYLVRIYGNMSLGPGNATHPLPQLGSQGTPFALCPSIDIDQRTQGGVTFTSPIVGEISWSSTSVNVVFPFVSYVNPYMPTYYGAY